MASAEFAKFPPEDVPTRSFMEDPKIKWRLGSRPDYDLVNLKYLKERTKHHAAESLEKAVENIIKTFEMEAAHKVDVKDWGSIVPDGSFRFKINNGRWYTAEDLVSIGSYNAFLMQCPFYSSKTTSFEDSHNAFKTCFSQGFAWEVLEAYANPPVVNVTWYHWAHFTGPYKETPPTNELLELTGTCVARVDSENRIQQAEIFYDPTPMMMTLNGGKVECPGAPKQG